VAQHRAAELRTRLAQTIGDEFRGASDGDQKATRRELANMQERIAELELRREGMQRAERELQGEWETFREENRDRLEAEVMGAVERLERDMSEWAERAQAFAARWGALDEAWYALRRGVYRTGSTGSAGIPEFPARVSALGRRPIPVDSRQADPTIRTAA
jgi:hypothetical protein